MRYGQPRDVKQEALARQQLRAEVRIGWVLRGPGLRTFIEPHLLRDGGEIRIHVFLGPEQYLLIRNIEGKLNVWPTLR